MNVLTVPNGIVVALFGIVLSASFCDICWTKRNRIVLAAGTAAILLLQGAITFGSLFAGLTAGAGVGLAVLWRVNPSWKQNLFMTGLLWAVGAAAGMLLQILPL